MTAKRNHKILKRTLCIIAIIFFHQLFQVNIYSSENHTFNLGRLIDEHSPILLKIEDEMGISYVVSNYYYGFDGIYNQPIRLKKIDSRGLMGETGLSKFLLQNNSKIKIEQANKLAKVYIKYCQLEGINHDIAFAQMCLETGFLKFGGSVSATQNNFCGLGAVNKTSAGASFKNREDGILAHIQHLKAYVSTNGLNSSLIDPRFNYVKRGTVKTIHDLTGKWATDPDYGEKLENVLRRMYSI